MLDHSTFGHRDEAACRRLFSGPFKAKPERIQVLDEAATVTAVSEHRALTLTSREPGRQRRHGGRAVVVICRVHVRGPDAPADADQDLLLTLVDLLAALRAAVFLDAWRQA